MKVESSKLCVHILPGKTHVISGAKSTLFEKGRSTKHIRCDCKACGLVFTFPLHERLIRIKSSAAEGFRTAQTEQHARDLLQPYDRYGNENRKFTREFGWNPYAPEKSGLNRQPNERAGGDSGPADNGTPGPLPTGGVPPAAQ